MARKLGRARWIVGWLDRKSRKIEKCYFYDRDEAYGFLELVREELFGASYICGNHKYITKITFGYEHEEV